MGIQFRNTFAALVTVAALSAPAHAALVISNKATKNVDCDGHGACKATAQSAVLNVQTVETMLGEFQSVDIVAPSLTKDIVVNAALSWTNSNELTLEAARSVNVENPIAVEGAGGLNFLTAQDGRGELSFAGRGSVSFRNAQGGLFIDGKRYTLASDLPTLAIDMDMAPSGYFALANDYDASADGAYATSVVDRSFSGIFEGLGHTISNLTISDFSGHEVGFFEITAGKIADITLSRFTLQDVIGCGLVCGSLAAHNMGAIERVFVSGNLVLTSIGQPTLGGIVGSNDGGIISDSHTDIALVSNACCIFGYVGGIAGANYATIDRSYAEGKVTAYAGDYGPGGISGYNYGIIKNSYSRSKVAQSGQRNGQSPGFYGGLVGFNDTTGKVISSYAAGAMGKRRTAAGAAGYEAVPSGGFSRSYWDLDDGVGDQSKGVGNIANYPGVNGLTTAQLQSGLPDGFDPKIWAENPSINSGLPYLISNPPEK